MSFSSVILTGVTLRCWVGAMRLPAFSALALAASSVTGQQTHLSDPTAKGDGVHLF